MTDKLFKNLKEIFIYYELYKRLCNKHLKIIVINSFNLESPDFLLCTKNETSCVLLIQLNMAVTMDLSPCTYYFDIPRNQTTSCQYKLSKKLVHRIL